MAGIFQMYINMDLKYLGHILMAMEDDCLEVVANLSKDRKKWAWMSRILGQEVVDA